MDRIGFNFPMVFYKKFYKNKISNYDADYIIVYKKFDILTRRHELLHAKYFMDVNYRKYY